MGPHLQPAVRAETDAEATESGTQRTEKHDDQRESGKTLDEIIDEYSN